MSVWTKDPADVDWFQFDWSGWLGLGETISSYTVAADSALTTVASSQSGPSVYVKVSGGVAGAQSTVTCEIVTSLGNTYRTEKTISIYNRTS